MIALPYLAGPLLSLAALSAQAVNPLDLLQPSAPSSFRQGTQAFRRVFPKVGLSQPLQAVTDLQADEDKKLLVILGDTSALDQIPGGIDHFLDRGGAILIATDRLSQGRWAQTLGVRVSGRFVRYFEVPGEEQPREPAPWYGAREFPHVLATPQSPLFAGVPYLATNRPSYLELLDSREPTDRRFVPMAKFVDGCVALGPRGAVPLNQSERPAWFAAGARRGRGRVLVVADHSVFINEMLLREDNHNLLFAANCLRWLNELGQRSQVLFVEEGAVATNFEESLAIPMPPPEALVPLINSALRGLEEENAFNNALVNMFSAERLLLWALGLATVILVGYGFVRLGKKRHHVEKGSLGLSALLARQSSSAAVVELRHKAMLEEGNLWEAARALARQCFDGALGQGAQAELSLLAAEWGEPPQVFVSGGWWRRWQLGQQVRRLWQLAYDPVPVAVSPAEFTQLATLVRAIREELSDGTVRIEPPVLA